MSMLKAQKQSCISLLFKHLPQETELNSDGCLLKLMKAVYSRCTAFKRLTCAGAAAFTGRAEGPFWSAPYRGCCKAGSAAAGPCAQLPVRLLCQ